jgi:ATP-dependent 26S proteasome regulatory subunit
VVVDELDPGLSKRPSRFDRKYLFDLPSMVRGHQPCGILRIEANKSCRKNELFMVYVLIPQFGK